MLQSLLVVLLQAAPKVAAPAWTTVNVQPALATFFADHLEQELRARGVAVVAAKDIALLLGLERQRQLLCADDAASCVMELGNALGCDGAMSVSLARLDEKLHATIKLLSSKDGRVLAETAAEGSSDAALLTELSRAAERLARQLGVDSPEVVAGRARRQSAWVPLVPAVALLAGGGACLGLAAGESKALDAELASQHLVTAEAEAHARTGKTLELLGWVGLGAGVAAGAAALVLYLSGEPPPVTPSVTTGPAGAVSFGVGGSLP